MNYDFVTVQNKVDVLSNVIKSILLEGVSIQK